MTDANDRAESSPSDEEFPLWVGLQNDVESAIRFWYASFLLAVSDESQSLVFRLTHESPLVVVCDGVDWDYPPPARQLHQVLWRTAGLLIGGRARFLSGGACRWSRSRGAICEFLARRRQRPITGVVRTDITKLDSIRWVGRWSQSPAMVSFSRLAS